MDSLPPRSICIAGGLVIAAGVSALVGMVASLFAGSFAWDVGFVAIPIGFGVLMGKESARAWATFFSVVIFLLFLVVMGFAISEYIKKPEQMQQPNDIRQNLCLFLVGGSCLYVWNVLARKSNRYWYEGEGAEQKKGKGLAWSVAIVLVVVCSMQTVERWSMKEQFERIFPVRTTVELFDAKTGEGLSTPMYDIDQNKSRFEWEPSLPPVWVNHASNDTGGRLLEFSGMATSPIDITLRSEGYLDTSITLDSESESKVEVLMRRDPEVVLESENVKADQQ